MMSTDLKIDILPVGRRVLFLATCLGLLAGCKRAHNSPAAPAAETAAGETPEKDLPETCEGIIEKLQSGSPEIPPQGVEEALAYLRKPAPAASGEEYSAEYFNLVIGLLLAQPAAVERLSGTLLAVADDPAVSPILQDYALQHFFHAWARDPNLQGKGELESRLKREIDDGKGPLCGTALLTSCRMFEAEMPITGPRGQRVRPLGSSPGIVPASRTVAYRRDDFIHSALRISSDRSGLPAVRTSAFNVLLRLGVRTSLAPARSVASDISEPEPVRCAAVAVLGSLGEPAGDRELLESIPLEPALVRTAAELALSRLADSSSRP